jgi:hypothetical protein
MVNETANLAEQGSAWVLTGGIQPTVEKPVIKTMQ